MSGTTTTTPTTTAIVPCAEWLERGYILQSHHTWEHDTTTGKPVQCSFCGVQYADFEQRADSAYDTYLEAYSE